MGDGLRFQRTGYMLIAVFFTLITSTLNVHAQGMDVTANLVVQGKASANLSKHKNSAGSEDIVVWLTPLQAEGPHPPAPHGPFRLVQKDKQFIPHLLIIPLGSSVEFPNQDPFFHNVFSLYNGKRFDLGLYEAGTKRSVIFDREGPSYIFCNIHPEMGAVVLALSTPYYGVANPSGNVTIHDVPAGNYHLHMWSETAQPVNPGDMERIVQISSAPVHLGEITLHDTTNPMEHHQNKFGEDYPANHNTPY